jgi:L-ascorbate metabolism protein UlaG (beta-lactamase superfamily)
MDLTYHGWSCFTLITASGRKLVFDPNWTNPFGTAHAAPAAFADAGLCLVTHGHFDHIQDVPGLMKTSRMILVASPEICRFLRDTHRIPADRMQELEMNRSLQWNGLTVTSFEWDHRIVDTSRMFAARPEATAMMTGLYHASPYEARRMGFTIRLEDGRCITNYCEGFNDQTRFELVRAVAERDHPEIVVAGAQLDYPRQVAEAATILNPRRLVLFHPHTDYFAFIGLASRPPGEFEAAVRGATPAVEVETVEPGRRLTL